MHKLFLFISARQKTKEVIKTDNWVVYSHHAVGLAISNNRRTNNDWFKKRQSKLNNRTTGKIGLKGLVFAQEMVLKMLDDGYSIVIQGTDYRRDMLYLRMLSRALSTNNTIDVDIAEFEYSTNDTAYIIVKNINQ